ncbi:MAG: hypothetical protein ACE5OW_01780 [Candidatus Bathyarchaeia archaeon]
MVTLPINIEKMKGIWLEDQIASHLLDLRRRRRIEDFYYQPFLRYFGKDVQPDFIVEITRNEQLEVDIIEAKDWNTDIILYRNHIKSLISADEAHDVHLIIEQMWRYDVGTMYEKAFKSTNRKRGELIVVTTATLFSADRLNNQEVATKLTIPITTRTIEGYSYVRLTKSHIHILSLDSNTSFHSSGLGRLGRVGRSET